MYIALPPAHPSANYKVYETKWQGKTYKTVGINKAFHFTRFCYYCNTVEPIRLMYKNKVIWSKN